jgi:hypothetical protein
MLSYAIADRLAQAFDDQPWHFRASSPVFIDYVRNSQGTGGKASEGREKSSLVEGLLIGIIHDGSWRNRDCTRSVHE